MKKVVSESVFLGTFICVLLASARCSHAQSGLRESLERLDRNENGEIDPNEITALARPYLERIAEARRMSLDRSYSIERYQEAARIYYALQNGVRDQRVRVQSESSIRSFEPDDEDEVIPDFGAPVIKYPYTQDDLDEAERTMRRYDRNDDGSIDRYESRRAVWTHRDPFEMDLNGDERLSINELAQRYARRRLLEDDSDELIKKARRTGNGIRPVERSDRGRDDDSRWWRRGGSSYWLTASLMGRFDANRNGRLESEESANLGLPVGQIDIDRNGEILRDELFAYVNELQVEAGDATSPLPGWFYELDADNDGQVAMSEFTEEWTNQKLQEFSLLDTNGDGLLTESEVAKSSAMVGGTFTNDNAEVLPPRKTVISEIEIDEDLMIGDLNLKVSITHTNTSYLDAYLTGPDGQRIELFTGVGGSGDHFSETEFDDQASTPIVKGRPPFEGRYQPSAATRRQPSLGHFNGKNARGVWQLVIRGTRSERFGMLHSWSLKIKPNDQLIDAAMTLVEKTSPNDSQTSSRTSSVSPAENGRKESDASGSSSRMGYSSADQETRKREWLEKLSAAKASGKSIEWNKDGVEGKKETSSWKKDVDWSKLTPEQAARYKALMQRKEQKQSKKEQRRK